MKYACISIEKGNILTSQNGVASERVINIGDHAQLLAIMNLYKQMGIREEDIVRIEYYDLLDYDGEYVVLPINFIYFNPYFGERELVFSPQIIPVFLGIHCIGMNFTVNEIDYLKKYAPIGCRDARTLELFRKQGITAYLHGCITATFPRREATENANVVYFVDEPGSLDKYVPEEIKDKAVFLSHQFYGEIGEHIKGISIEQYMRERLDLYASTARLVVTSRLHCAVPCIAMGIPTIFAVEKYSSSYAWLESLTKVYVKDEFKDIDWKAHEIDYENQKKCIIELDKARISETYNKYQKIFDVSTFYESRKRKEYEDAYIIRLREHIDKYWQEKKQVKYILWGITQISEVVFKYIEQYCPQAQLVAIFDDYRDVSFHGIKSVKTNTIEKYSDCCVIATGNSSSAAANKLFRKMNYPRELYCTCFSGVCDDIREA